LSINGAVEEDFRIPFSIPFGDVAGLRWWQLRLSINGAVREIFCIPRHFFCGPDKVLCRAEKLTVNCAVPLR
jgi:hypothetical protein